MIGAVEPRRARLVASDCLGSVVAPASLPSSAAAAASSLGIEAGGVEMRGATRGGGGSRGTFVLRESQFGFSAGEATSGFATTGGAGTAFATTGGAGSAFCDDRWCGHGRRRFGLCGDRR